MNRVRERPDSETRCPQVDTARRWRGDGRALFKQSGLPPFANCAKDGPPTVLLMHGRSNPGPYFFFFPLACFGAGLGAGFFAAGFAGLCAGAAALDFSGAFAAAFAGGAAGGGTGATAAAAFPFFPFGPGLPAAATTTGASGTAFAARPRRGAGGGGGGGGANGFRNFNVSVRERSLPSSNSMKTSCAIFGYTGN